MVKNYIIGESRLYKIFAITKDEKNESKKLEQYDNEKA